jgi:hypothetical protein
MLWLPPPCYPLPCPAAGGNAAVWSSVWQLVASIQSLDPDRDLLSSLRELKGHFSGDRLKDACGAVKLSLKSHQGSKDQRSLLSKADSRYGVYATHVYAYI